MCVREREMLSDLMWERTIQTILWYYPVLSYSHTHTVHTHTWEYSQQNSTHIYTEIDREIERERVVGPVLVGQGVDQVSLLSLGNVIALVSLRPVCTGATHFSLTPAVPLRRPVLTSCSTYTCVLYIYTVHDIQKRTDESGLGVCACVWRGSDGY